MSKPGTFDLVIEHHKWEEYAFDQFTLYPFKTEAEQDAFLAGMECQFGWEEKTLSVWDKERLAESGYRSFAEMVKEQCDLPKKGNQPSGTRGDASAGEYCTECGLYESETDRDAFDKCNRCGVDEVAK